MFNRMFSGDAGRRQTDGLDRQTWTDGLDGRMKWMHWMGVLDGQTGSTHWTEVLDARTAGRV